MPYKNCKRYHLEAELFLKKQLDLKNCMSVPTPQPAATCKKETMSIQEKFVNQIIVRQGG
jgi:hypothetical protein